MAACQIVVIPPRGVSLDLASVGDIRYRPTGVQTQPQLGMFMSRDPWAFGVYSPSHAVESVQPDICVFLLSSSHLACFGWWRGRIHQGYSLHRTGSDGRGTWTVTLLSDYVIFQTFFLNFLFYILLQRCWFWKLGCWNPSPEGLGLFRFGESHLAAGPGEPFSCKVYHYTKKVYFAWCTERKLHPRKYSVNRFYLSFSQD